jgi:defect-in-organelle-trafficking protein DotD
MLQVMVWVSMLTVLGCHRNIIVEDGMDEPSLTAFDFNQTPQAYEQVNAEAQLAEAAAGVSRTLNTLAAMQRAKDPHLYRDLPDVGTTRQTAGIASVHWVGPIEPLLTQIAQKTGLRFVTYGQRTATPIIVSIDAKQQTIESIIQDISYQAQSHAIIKVHAAKRSLELRYTHG